MLWTCCEHENLSALTISKIIRTEATSTKRFFIWRKYYNKYCINHGFIQAVHPESRLFEVFHQIVLGTPSETMTFCQLKGELTRSQGHGIQHHIINILYINVYVSIYWHHKHPTSSGYIIIRWLTNLKSWNDVFLGQLPCIFTIISISILAFIHPHHVMLKDLRSRDAAPFWGTFFRRNGEKS